MPVLNIEIGVVVARRIGSGAWASETWHAVSVLPAAPPVPPWTPLGRIGSDETFYGGAVGLGLHSGETSHYRDNLASGAPALWIALAADGDHPRLAAATADPYEGEGLSEGYGEMIEQVPMPDAIRDIVAAFVAEHHVERPFFKRKRDRLDPRKGGSRPSPGLSAPPRPGDDDP